MKRMADQIVALFLCIAELAVGILLLIDPAGFTGILIAGVGWLLTLVGLWSCIRYFMMNAQEAAKRQLLFHGLCALLIGLFMAFRVDWILSVFPILTVLYGVCVLLISLRRLQWMMDMIRMGSKRWYWCAIGAVLSLAVAVIILMNPFGMVSALWIFTGIALIVEAVVDVLTLIFSWKANRQKANEDINAGEASIAAHTDIPQGSDA